MNNDNINDIANRICAALDSEVTAMGGSYEIDTKAVIMTELAEDLLQR